MGLIPRRLSLPNVKDELRDLNQELYDYLVALNKQLTRSYDAMYISLKPEEGTFLPEIWDASLSGAEGQTYTRQYGFYTLINERVYFDIYLVLSSKGTLTSTDSVYVGNLPFLAKNDIYRYTAVNVGYSTGLNLSAAYNISAYVINGQDYMYMRVWDVTSGTSPLLVSELTDDSGFVISGNYAK